MNSIRIKISIDSSASTAQRDEAVARSWSNRYAAAVMHLLHTDVRIPQPSSAAGIRVYLNRAGRKVPKIESKFGGAAITLAEILRDPEKYVLISRPSMIAADFESTVPTATLGVYSMWSGYLTKPDWVAVRDIIQNAPGDFVECHASGHISVPDIDALVAALSPRRIVPIHTSSPTAFGDRFQQALSAIDGQSIEL